MLIVFIGRAKTIFKRQCRIAEAISNEIGPSARVRRLAQQVLLRHKLEGRGCGCWWVGSRRCILGMFSSVHFNMLHETGSESQDGTESVEVGAESR